MMPPFPSAAVPARGGSKLCRINSEGDNESSESRERKRQCLTRGGRWTKKNVIR